MVFESNTYIDISPYHEILSGMNFILSISVGVVKLTGPTGTGKTRLLQQLQDELEAERQETILFLTPPASIKDMQDAISRKLRLDNEFGFNKALIHHIIAKPYDQQRLVLAFDEAEKIDIDVLLAIALFRNITHNSQPIVSIVLCGSDALNARLDDIAYRPLVQDMLLSYELNPLTREQLQAYGNACADLHRLGKLPLKNGVLTELLAESKGLPGTVPDLLKQLRDKVDSGALSARAENLEKTKTGDARAVAVEASNAETAADGAPIAAPPAIDPSRLSPDERLILASRAEKDASGPRKFKLSLAIASQHRKLAQGVALAAGVAVVAFLAGPRVAPTVSNLYSNLTSDAEQAPAVIAAASDASAPTAEAAAAPEGADVSSQSDELPSEGAATGAIPAEAAVPRIADAPEATPVVADAPAEAKAPSAEESTPELVAEAAAETPPAAALPEPEPAQAPQVVTALPPTAPQSAAPAPATVANANGSLPNGNPDELQQVIRGWLMAWEEQDVDNFFSYYHTDFAPLYQDTVADWRMDRQTKISRPDSITIELEDFTIGNSSTIGTRVSFWMNYAAPGYADRTKKEVLIGRDLDGQWRILQEYNQQVAEVDPSTFRAGVALNSQTSQSPASSASLTQDQIAEIARFLAAWLTDWQNQNVDGYFSHYESDYKSESMASVEEWRNDRTTKIRRPTRIVLRMDELEILAGDDDSVRVQLVLEYHSTHYADRTVKEIGLKKAASGEWRITEERNRQIEVLPVMRLLPVDSLAFLVMNR
ncbi:MAG: hypothetical protein RLZZ227_2750 [Pseudomonadota bacterium]|jgi:type II secretory pathway predicted ATPase ExeA/ketosteroid isomerase-like protein